MTFFLSSFSFLFGGGIHTCTYFVGVFFFMFWEFLWRISFYALWGQSLVVVLERFLKTDFVAGFAWAGI